jgi:ribokinase
MGPGGKGSNQAVCYARLGAEVYFIGCVDNDNFGEMAKDFLLE